jgi:hypothetical protein
MAATAQASFGLSISQAAIEMAETGTVCTSDYITITGGDIIGNILAANAGTTVINTRFCGRGLSTVAAAANAGTLVSVCTNSVPFQIGVNFDGDEVSLAIGAANMHEADDVPGGIIGFCLNYTTQ